MVMYASCCKLVKHLFAIFIVQYNWLMQAVAL